MAKQDSIALIANQNNDCRISAWMMLTLARTTDSHCSAPLNASLPTTLCAEGMRVVPVGKTHGVYRYATIAIREQCTDVAK
jgi:hypothetical protein